MAFKKQNADLQKALEETNQKKEVAKTPEKKKVKPASAEVSESPTLVIPKNENPDMHRTKTYTLTLQRNAREVLLPEIMEKQGYTSASAFITDMIINLHDQLFPKS